MESFFSPIIEPVSMALGVSPALGFVFFLALMVWSVVWKGLALWKSARQTDKTWFIVLLVVNTLGVLEIIYLYFFAKKKEGQGTSIS